MGACCSCCNKGGGEASYTVRMAGQDCVSGDYKPNGTYKNRPMYQQAGGNFKMWYNEGEWRIGGTNDYYYVNKDDGETPPMAGWIIPKDDKDCNSSACEPCPTVVKKMSCCCC